MCCITSLKNNKIQSKYLFPGDIICVGGKMQTFKNDTDGIVEFIALRLVIEGKNKRHVKK